MMTDAEMDAQIVAVFAGLRFTRAELSRYFAAVENREHWKLPIEATVVLPTLRDVIGTCEAVKFFTGSIAQTTQINSGQRAFLVTAVGYYAAIGA